MKDIYNLHTSLGLNVMYVQQDKNIIEITKPRIKTISRSVFFTERRDNKNIKQCQWAGVKILNTLGFFFKDSYMNRGSSPNTLAQHRTELKLFRDHYTGRSRLAAIGF